MYRPDVCISRNIGKRMLRYQILQALLQPHQRPRGGDPEAIHPDLREQCTDPMYALAETLANGRYDIKYCKHCFSRASDPEAIAAEK